MSTPDSILFQIRVKRRKGVRTPEYMEHIRNAVGNYKGGLYPDDALMDYRPEDVEVFKRERRMHIGWAVVCHGDPEFPKFFKDLETAREFRENYKGTLPVKLVGMKATKV